MLNVNDLLRSAQLFVVAKDTRNRFLHCTENFVDYFGLDSPKQMIGKDDFDFFPYDYAKFYQEGDFKALKGEHYVNVPEVCFTPKQPLSVLVNKVPLKNRKDETIGIIISLIISPGRSYPGFQYNPMEKRYLFKIGSFQEYFTFREYSVFFYIVRGLTGAQIAKQLSLSVRTVEQYIDTIKMKLQCSSKFQIAQTAIDMGLIPNIPFFLPS